MFRRLAATNASMSGIAGNLRSANNLVKSPKSARDLGGNAIGSLLGSWTGSAASATLGFPCAKTKAQADDKLVVAVHLSAKERIMDNDMQARNAHAGPTPADEVQRPESDLGPT